MLYTESVQLLLSLVDMERIPIPKTRKGRPRFDLSRMRTILQRLNQPEAVAPTIHITGTKGKGSTAAMTTAILEECGYRVGLYTSPHLHYFRERIRLGMTPISPEEFSSLLEELWPIVEGEAEHGETGRPTVFEVLTVMAFMCFAKAGIDVQVLEVGLGGTLDATNVVPAPEVCVITSISLDHTNVLGNTVEEIAWDKAGIIKSGSTVITAPQSPEVMAILDERCQNFGVRLLKVEENFQWKKLHSDLLGQDVRLTGHSGAMDFRIPLLGRHQIENACCALLAVEVLGRMSLWANKREIARGLGKTEWPGRMEVIKQSPTVIVDGAHNPYSIQTVLNDVPEPPLNGRRLLILGFSHGHDVEGMVREVVEFDPDWIVVTCSRHPRAVRSSEIVQYLASYGVQATQTESVGEAVDLALSLATPEDLILSTGSLFIVAEVRERVIGIPPELYPAQAGF